jgi:hypothetical protein
MKNPLLIVLLYLWGYNNPPNKAKKLKEDFSSKANI